MVNMKITKQAQLKRSSDSGSAVSNYQYTEELRKSAFVYLFVRYCIYSVHNMVYSSVVSRPEFSGRPKYFGSGLSQPN
jgi:hypothetical protein